MGVHGVKRAALVGTAPSWVKTPWADPNIYIVSLNDAYSLQDNRGQGFPRADAWYDIHPFDEMWFRPKGKTVFKEGDIPEGAYVRPEGHLEWLQERAKSIQVWVQDPPDGWPVNARKFPMEDVKSFMKARPDQECYSASSPAPILAHLFLQGFREIHIYGIHLSTQKEYIEQRPNFEWLMSKVEALGCNLVIPPECPLLKHTHVYGYEKAPVRADLPALKRKRAIELQMQKVANELISWPRWKSKAEPMARLSRLKAELKDAQMQGRHLTVTAGV